MTRGDTRLDNRKTKAALGGRPRMLDPGETLELTSHPVGGVCPFGLPTALPIYCDQSLQDFAVVYPAAGSLNSSVAVSPYRLVGWQTSSRASGSISVALPSRQSIERRGGSRF